MKHMRKLASLLLALTLVFALATTAFADGTPGSITVENPIAGQTYTAYKIFDVVYNSGKTAYSYTIENTSAWFGTVQTYATEANGLTLTQVNGSTTYNVTTTGTFSAPNFAVALKAAVTGKNGTELTKQSDGTVSVSNLPLGYYFVTSSTGALCNLTTTNPTVTIHDKNDMPFDKVDDKVSADVGETVTYTITGKVPDTTGFTSYTYKITDTMSEGLTFKKDVAVKIGNTNIDAATVATWITYKPNTDAATGFELTIPVMNYQNNVGAAISVSYSAVVNENAVAKIENNSATLTYSNDPSDSTKTTTTPEDKETVYSAKIVIDKYKTGNESTKLAGAKFVLYKRGTGTDTAPTGKDYDTVTEGNKTTYYPREYYQYTEATGNEGAKVEWVTDKAKATSKTTDDNGAASFDGLANGTYYLEETAAPAGYNMLTDPVTVTVNGANATVADLSTLTVTADVENNTGSLLPSTGGMGTTLFYVLGGILAVTAVVLLVTKKRMNSAE